jgi:homoserine dehydrogenase
MPADCTFENSGMIAGMARDLRLALVGFGHVGRRFAELLTGPYARILRDAGVRPVLTGVATAHHGIAVDAAGLDPRRCLAALRAGGSLDSLHRGRPLTTSLEFVRRVPADVLLEVTPLDPQHGKPATAHVAAALRRGLHVVTANKGPVAFALRALRALARRRRRFFLHEGAVMDGTPVFNLKERCLEGARVLGFRGTLNATSNHILSTLEAGRTFREALSEAQAQGIAEADPSHDIEGWDAAVKGCALANALMDASVRPAQVRRRGIVGLGIRDVQRALRLGRRLRLVVRGRRDGARVRVSVGPEEVPLGDPLAVGGPDAVLLLDTDVMGEIGVVERGMALDQTTYALLSDLLRVAREKP